MDDSFGFRQKSKDVARGFDAVAEDATPSEQSGQFAATIGKPVWRQFVADKSFQEANAGAIDAEKNYQARMERQNRSSRVAAPKPVEEKWGGDNGRLFRKSGAGLEEFDAEEYAEDPVAGSYARKSLFDKERRATKAEAKALKMKLEDPYDKRALSDKERAAVEQDIELYSTATDAESKKLLEERKTQLAKADERLADEKAAFDAGYRDLQHDSLDPDTWWQSRAKPGLEDKRQAAIAEDAAHAESVSRADESLMAERRELEAKISAGVRGPELDTVKTRLAEMAAAGASIAEERQKSGQAVEAVRGEAVSEIEREKRGKETEIRGTLNVLGVEQFGGGKVSGVEKGNLEKTKDFLNEAGSAIIGSWGAFFRGKDIDGQIEAMVGADKPDYDSKNLNMGVGRTGSREAYRESLAKRISEAKGRKLPTKGYETQLQFLEAQDAEFAKVGITDPREQDRIFKDAVRESAWTENDTDNVRSLSTGEVAINPGRIYGDYAGMVADIKAKSGSDADAAEAITRLDHHREKLAEARGLDAWYSDSKFSNNNAYRKYEKAMEDAGVTDKVAILDGFTAEQKDRNPGWKGWEAISNALIKGEVAVGKTFVGTAAGLSSLTPADGMTKALANNQAFLGDVIEGVDKGQELRGQTGGYAVATDLGSTVIQMAPMFAGAKLAGGLNGLSQTLMKAAAVPGWAGAQGYESKLSDAVSFAEEEMMTRQRRGLTPEERANVIGSKEAQLSALANGGQTALLSLIKPGGAERAALGTAAANGSMTLRDFLSRGGREALKNSKFRQELKKIGKTIFADAKDEFIEEGLNQFLDKTISSIGLDQEFKLGDAFYEAFEAGLMGAAVGGGLPQLRQGKRTQANPLDGINARITAADPQAAPTTEEEAVGASEFTQDAENLDDVADAVIVNRELADLEFSEDEAMGEAEATLIEAQASGDTVAIKAAEGEVERVRKNTGKATRARAVLKLTSGSGMEDLTDGEARSLGFEISDGGLKPLKGKDLEAAGLTKPLVRAGADGSPIVLDEALKELEGISPRARARIGMTEAQAAKAAQTAATEPQEASQTPATDSTKRKFTVGLRSGSSIEVEATDEASAEQEAAAVADEQIVPGSAVVVNETGGSEGQADLPSTGETQSPPAESPKTEMVSPEAIKVGDQVKIGGGIRTVTTTTPQTLNESPTITFDDGTSVSGTPFLQVERVLPDVKETADPYTSPAGNVNETPKTGQVPGTKALAVATKRVETLRKSKRLSAAIRVSTDPNIRAQANEDGTIDVNLEGLIAEAIELGMTEAKAAQYASRVIDEEIRHLAQHDAAKALYEKSDKSFPFHLWRAGYYADIWANEFLATGKAETIATLYGKEGKGIEAFNAMEDWRKAFEAIRMMSQGNKTPEAASLWANIGAELRAALEAALAALKNIVADISASPALKAEIEALEAALKQIKTNEQSAGNSNTDGKKPSPGKKTSGAGSKAKTGRNRKTGDNGKADPAPGNPPAGAIAPGARVSVLRGSENLTGVVQLVRGDGQVVKVKLDEPSSTGLTNLAVSPDEVTVLSPAKAEETPEWVNFPAEDTLGIPRAMMPQVAAENRSALVQFLKARGAKYSEAEIRPDEISPSQVEYSPAKVQKAREYTGGDRALLVDRNNRLLDGHHQWLAALDNPSQPVRVIRFEMEAQEILPLMLEMPSTETSDESGTSSTTEDSLVVSESAHPKPKKPRSTSSPARREAQHLLANPDTIQTIANLIANVGRIPRPNVGMLKIIGNLRKSKNLTEKQRKMLDKWGDYSAYLPKNAFSDDHWGKVARELHGMLFTEGATNTLDHWAKQISDETTNDEAMLAVMGELTRVARGVKEAGNESDPNRELTEEEEQQLIAFDDANFAHASKMGVRVGDEEVGNSLVIGGENFTVTAKGDSFVTLEDGEKFGTQRMNEDSVLWLEIDGQSVDLSAYPQDVIEAMAREHLDMAEQEGYEDHREYDEANPEKLDQSSDQISGSSGSGSGASPQSSSQGNGTAQSEAGSQVKSPTSQMDIRNADAKELFDDDGGFALTGDKTQDGDKIAAERKAQEEAQAAMDAAQGNLFGEDPEPTTPPISEADQALLDAMEGLFAAPLPPKHQSGLSLPEIRDAMGKYPGSSYKPDQQKPSVASYAPFRLRPDGVTLYIKSNTGALFPDGHEIKITGTPPNEIPDGGGAFWDGLRNGGRRAAIQRGINQPNEDPENFRWLASTLQFHEGIGQKGDVASTWKWISDALNTLAIDRQTAENLAETLPGFLGIKGFFNEEQSNTSRYLYSPIGKNGEVIVMDVHGAKVTFGRMPNSKELSDAKKAHEEDPQGFPLYSSPLPESFTAPVPTDRIAPLVTVATKYLAEGVDTPAKLAEKLDTLADGKMRKFSQSIWFAFKMAGVQGEAEPDWSGIFSKTTQSISNDESTGSNLEPDRGDAGSSNPGGQSGLRPQSGSTRGDGERVVSDGEGGRDAGTDTVRADDVPADAGRTGSDQQSPAATSEPSQRPAGNEQPGGSREPDATGVEAYGRGENDAHDGLVIPGTASTVAEGGIGSRRDAAGVKRSAPALKAEQAEDVAFIEKRLIENGKPGVLLTNGTGTGKTFSGFGAIKRALDRGERHVIILAPSDKVGSDWVATGKAFFGVDDIAQLEGIKDTGESNRVVVTTYANFGQNMELVRRPWGMVVTDEAHYLSQSKDGNSTLALKTFRGLTWHPKDGVRNRVDMEMAEEIAEMASLRESIESNNRIANRDDTMDQMRSAIREENAAHETRIAEITEKRRLRTQELQKLANGIKEADRPKAIFLSATPFAYHFSLDYAEGYLFEFGAEPESRAYNTPSPRDRFYVENFGYRMRYNKLTKPENAAATGILERMFAERMKREGAMRGRMLSVPFDYSRDFVLAESMIGTHVDRIFDLITQEERFAPLRQALEIGDYLARRYLLEGLKAKEAVKRIREHHALGRKVVVFHDYKKGGAVNPLRLIGGGKEAMKAYGELRAAVPGFDNLVTMLDGLQSPIDVIQKAFPQAGIFNGDVPKKKRREIVGAFNLSGGEMNVILAQRASGKEGISLHDIDGRHQRAFIDLGIPGRPTDAIQSEGRTIRLGMQSNGVIEYLTTGTNFERWTFAQTIATRASTAENLAMGESARALLQSFSSGYNDARTVNPSNEQGTGGKKADAAREAGNPFDNAVALYFTNQKKTSRNKAAEGVDYFATPEPLGFKMVEWAGIRPGEKVLEPSGGHGAIARFFPDSANRHAVEPSMELAGRLALNAPDTRLHQTRFEDYDVVNKFDAVVMNPPFGTAGKTAMEHLEKAIKHLRQGGRVVALIPEGSSMGKRFDKWYETAEGVFLTAEIKLPSVTFERAGTSVSARIVVLDRVSAENAPQQVTRDYTDAATTKDLFARIKESTIPDRPAPETQKTPSEMMADLLGSGRDAKIPEQTTGDFAPAEFNHTRNGNLIYVAKITRNLDREEYVAAKDRAKSLGGNYSSFRGSGAIPGFHFPDAESRDSFVNGGESAPLQTSPLPNSGGQREIGGVEPDYEIDKTTGIRSAKVAGIRQWNEIAGHLAREASRLVEVERSDGSEDGSARPITERLKGKLAAIPEFDHGNEALVRIVPGESVYRFFPVDESGIRPLSLIWRSAPRGVILSNVAKGDSSTVAERVMIANSLPGFRPEEIIAFGKDAVVTRSPEMAGEASEVEIDKWLGEHGYPHAKFGDRMALLVSVNGRKWLVDDLHQENFRTAEDGKTYVTDFTTAKLSDEDAEKVFTKETLEEVDDSLYAAPLPSTRDTDYLAAVEAGDMATAQRMVDEAAKAAGYAVKAYKGMRKFNWRNGEEITLINSDNGPWAGFFSSSKEVAEGFVKWIEMMSKPSAVTNLVHAFLNLDNAMTIDAKGAFASEFQVDVNFKDPSTYVGVQAKIRKALEGGRSVIIQNTRDEADVFIAAKPEHVKSADPVTRDADGNVIPLSQRFDQSSDSILRTSPLPSPERETADNIASLRMEGRKKISKPLADEARKQQKLFADEGKVVGVPRLANPGDTDRSRSEQDVVDALYEHDRQVREDKSVIAEGRRRFEEDEKGIEEMLLNAAFGDKQSKLDDSDQIAARLLINKRAREAGNDLAKHEANMVLRMAYRMQRADIARELRIGFDLFKTPEERALEQITDAIYQPTLKTEKKARNNNWSPQKRREFIRAASKARLGKIEKALRGMGVTLDEITSGEAFLSLSQEEILANALKQRSAEEQYVIKLIQKKWTLPRIRKTTGLTEERISEINKKLYDELMEKAREKARAGIRLENYRDKQKGLQAAPLFSAPLSDADIEAEARRIVEIGFGISPEVAKQSVSKKKEKLTQEQKQERKDERNSLTANWTRPIFTDGLNSYTFDTKDRTEIMQRAQAIRDIASATGKIKDLTGIKKAKAEKLLSELNSILAKYGTDADKIFDSAKPVDDYRFDLKDRAHVAAVARAIRAVDADIIDKGVEWTFASILSGLQTMFVNAGAAIPAGWDMTMGRAFESAVNLVFRDPMAATFGESKYILKAAGPTLARAWGNAVATWGAELPMFDEDFLGKPADLDKLFDGKAPKIGVISGKKGRIIRIPTRMLLATDDFNRTAIAVMEVGAMAYRLARAQGMEPGTPEFDRFLKIQVNTPGSLAGRMAAEKAAQLIFANALPGQSSHVDGHEIPVEGIGDLIGAGAAAVNAFITQDRDSLFAKGALALTRVMFLPFQRTPFNIMRRGIRHTLNPISLIDIAVLIGKNSVTIDADTGKAKWGWNVAGRQAEIIERSSQQLQGGMLLLLLMALGAGEGDEEDMEKRILITGTQPWLPQKRAEREAQRRAGIDPYRISFRSKDGKERFGFNYGRLEPLGTTLGLTIDAIKNFKQKQRSGGNVGDAALSILGGTVAAAQEKTYLSGISDLFSLGVDSIADEDFKFDARMQRFAASRLGMVIPNVIKQPIRESDPYFRDKAGSFTEEMMYQAVPAGQKEAKTTPYGEKESKPGSSVSRIFDIGNTGTHTVNPIDEMLLRFESRNPGEGWFPSDPRATFTDPRTGEENVKMTPAQASEFKEKAGKRAVALLKREVLNLDNPTERDKEVAKKAFTKARSDVKKLLTRNPAWLNKK